MCSLGVVQSVSERYQMCEQSLEKEMALSGVCLDITKQ